MVDAFREQDFICGAIIFVTTKWLSRVYKVSPLIQRLKRVAIRKKMVAIDKIATQKIRWQALPQ
jgi:hypothetical protein